MEKHRECSVRRLARSGAVSSGVLQSYSRSSGRIVHGRPCPFLGMLALVLSTTLACDSSTSPPAPESFLLEVVPPPEGAGTIQSQPAGIDCPGACSAEFTEGTAVYLNVFPSSGWTFLGWSGACTGTGDFCSVLMSATVQVTVSFDGTPNPPTDFRLEVISPYQIDLHWQDNSPIETSFEIERQVPLEPGLTVIVTPANTESYSDTDLLPETTYNYRLRACRGDECSDFLGPMGITTLPEPTLEAVAVTQAGIELSWPEDKWNGTGYRVEQSPDGSTGWIEIGTTDAQVTSYLVKDLLPGTTYYFRLRVCDETDCEDISDFASATTPPPFSTVSGGRLHTCGITSSGEAYCWGTGLSGRLGTGGTTWHNTPSPVLGGLRFSSISLGYYHTCGVTPEGQGYCWGRADLGSLGIGEVDEDFRAYAPTPVSGGLAFQSIGAGWRFSCGLTLDGDAYCWGQGDVGKLGTGGFEAQFSPVPVAGGLTFQSISVGTQKTCGLTESGEAWCWGSGYEPAPVAVVGAPAFASIHAGGSHTCGITAAGEAYCWGAGENGQLGDGFMTDQVNPVAVAGGLTFQSLSLGVYHTCGLTTSGVVYCWGLGELGSLGNGGDVNVGTPVPVEGGLAFSAIGCGAYQSCAVATNGQVFCWGSDFGDALGTGWPHQNEYSPVATWWAPGQARIGGWAPPAANPGLDALQGFGNEPVR